MGTFKYILNAIALFTLLLTSCSDAQAQSNPICEATNGHKCYYVAASGGSDSNTGAFNAPYNSFLPALRNAQAGDFIYARGGTYDFDNAMPVHGGFYAFISIQDFSGHFTDIDNGSSGLPITIKNYASEIPVLNYNDSRFAKTEYVQYAVYIREKSFWTLQGLEIVGGLVNLNAYHDGNTSNGSLTHDIVIKNNHFHGVTGSYASNMGVIRIDRGDNGGAYNIYIQNNLFHDIFYGSGWNGAFGALTTLSCQQYAGWDCGHTGNIEFTNNTVYNMPQVFFFKNPTTGPVLIENNIIYNVWRLMSSTQSNVTIRRNLIYNLQETASENVIWVLGHDYDAGLSSQLWAIEGRNTLFEYNTIVGMTGLIGVQIGSGNIHHNVFFGLMPLGQYLSYMRKTSAYPDQPLVANSILQDFDSDYNCFITPVDNFQMASRYTGDAYNRAQALATFGWDPHSTFITEDNPADVFISPAAGNYRLKDSPPNPAPCQGMGYYADGVSDTNPPAAVSNLQVH